MLKMKCPKCDEMIVSALLSDMDQVPCEHCQELVPVGNVMVFAEGFTFHRNDLVKRLFRYKTLLDEICKERDLLDKNPNASDESKKSLGRFAQALAEVMAGARNNLRIDFTEPISISYRVNTHVQSAFLTNLSMSGACVDVAPKAPCPRKKTVLSIEFALPGIDCNFILTGTTSWSKRGKSFGIKFNAIDEQTIENLWDFITSSVEN
jgi:PilZ domain